MPRILVVFLAALALLALSGPAGAELPPAKPYADLVSEVITFLYSDVGNGGIRTNDDDVWSHRADVIDHILQELAKSDKR